MSRHEGVSCDACMRTNFRGKRYKCLVCYDYDLCANCYESGSFSSRPNGASSSSGHSIDHPMQCILTQADHDLYYGNEGGTGQTLVSITCPVCGNMGFTEATLQTHVQQAHQSRSQEVVCPLCATLPNGDPNFVTDDYARHLSRVHASRNASGGAVEEEGGSRGGSGGLGPQLGRRRGAPAVAGSTSSGLFHSGRAILRRRNGGVLNLTSSTSATTSVGSSATTSRSAGEGGGATSSGGGSGGGGQTSASLRDAVDPIAELLSQLSGVRRSGGTSGSRSAEAQAALSSTASHLQQLQWQLQLERQHVQSAREQLSRIPRRPVPTQAQASGQSDQPTSSGAGGGGSSGAGGGGASKSGSQANSNGDFSECLAIDFNTNSRYLLHKLNPSAPSGLAAKDESIDVVEEVTKEPKEYSKRVAFVEDTLLSSLQIQSKSSNPTQNDAPIGASSQNAPMPAATGLVNNHDQSDSVNGSADDISTKVKERGEELEEPSSGLMNGTVNHNNVNHSPKEKSS